MTALAPVLEGFFTDRLYALRASEHTVAGYRDTYRLLLRFAHQRTGRQPSQLDLSELDATLIGAFLDHLEGDRANSVATRNVRMAAIRALFRYAALRCPEHAGLIQRVLAIPTKRGDRQLVTFLTRTELTALLAATTRRCLWDVATTYSSPSRSRPGSASPNSPASPAPTPSSALERTSAAQARAERNESPPSPKVLPATLPAGSRSDTRQPRSHCSPPSAANDCPTTPSSGCSPSTSPSQPKPARR